MIDAIRRLGSNTRALIAVAAIAILAVGLGLGGGSRLTYHEAIAAQSAREMIASGEWVVPTLAGRPWLEKPPLTIWLIATLSKVSGEVTEVTARLPSALAALVLALAVGWFASRRFGQGIGLLAGLIQATSVWTVTRGRLAEADMLLATIITATLIAFDLLREEANAETVDETRLKQWRWAFFGGLGISALSKGIGFGAVLILAVAAVALLLDLDRKTLARLRFAPGWALALGLAIAWPILVLRVHPSAISLWFLHVSDRLADEPKTFNSQSTLNYAVAILGFLLPWTPLAVAGAVRAFPRMLRRRTSERFLAVWMVAPLALLSLATVKHAHYAIYALPPCSVWAAFGLARVGERLQNGGLDRRRVRRLALGGFVGLGLAYGLGFATLGPWLDRRGVEWGFYQTIAPKLRPSEPVVLLYHVPDWDRFPYQTPFGPFPHDLAVRLFYLNRPAECRYDLADLQPEVDRGAPFAVIGREVDRDGLARFGTVETLAESPKLRFDREYWLYRVTPRSAEVAAGPKSGAAEPTQRR